MSSLRNFNLGPIADSTIIRQRRQPASLATIQSVINGEIENDVDTSTVDQFPQDTSAGASSCGDDDLMNLAELEQLIQTYYKDEPQQPQNVASDSESGGRCDLHPDTSTSKDTDGGQNGADPHTHQSSTQDDACATGITRLTLSVNGTSTAYMVCEATLQRVRDTLTNPQSSPRWRSESPRDLVTVQMAQETLEGRVRSEVVERMQEDLKRRTRGAGR